MKRPYWCIISHSDTSPQRVGESNEARPYCSGRRGGASTGPRGAQRGGSRAGSTSCPTYWVMQHIISKMTHDRQARDRHQLSNREGLTCVGRRGRPRLYSRQKVWLHRVGPTRTLSGSAPFSLRIGKDKNTIIDSVSQPHPRRRLEVARFDRPLVAAVRDPWNMLATS